MLYLYQAVGAYLGQILNTETQTVQSSCDGLDDSRLHQDQWDIAFICGLPFMRYCRIAPGQLAPLVAPVMQADRYRDQPVYFSDVIVSATSPITTFAHLAGKTFCYNDPGSNSGYHLMCQRLIQEGRVRGFWGRMIQSGSHQSSIRWVIQGLADCAAIDSTVLEQELRDFPELADHLRVVESIGPCPIPPIVAAQRLGSTVLGQLQAALLQPDSALQKVMNQARIKRFAIAKLEDYAAIAHSYDTVVQADIETIV